MATSTAHIIPVNSSKVRLAAIQYNDGVKWIEISFHETVSSKFNKRYGYSVVQCAYISIILKWQIIIYIRFSHCIVSR